MKSADSAAICLCGRTYLQSLLRPPPLPRLVRLRRRRLARRLLLPPPLIEYGNQRCYITGMQNCRFAFAVHVMAVLAWKKSECCPSSRLAQTVNTNPVVIRRLLIDLQDAGLISTARGPRGGATLKRRPEKVTLSDIHNAVDQGNTFATHPNEQSQDCPV